MMGTDIFFGHFFKFFSKCASKFELRRGKMRKKLCISAIIACLIVGMCAFGGASEAGGEVQTSSDLSFLSRIEKKQDLLANMEQDLDSLRLLCSQAKMHAAETVDTLPAMVEKHSSADEKYAERFEKKLGNLINDSLAGIESLTGTMPQPSMNFMIQPDSKLDEESKESLKNRSPEPEKAQ